MNESAPSNNSKNSSKKLRFSIARARLAALQKFVLKLGARFLTFVRARALVDFLFTLFFFAGCARAFFFFT